MTLWRLGVVAASKSGVAGLAAFTHGYIMGGQGLPAPYFTTVSKFVFGTDTTSVLGTGLNTARSRVAQLASSESAYAAGGNNQSPSSTSTFVEKFAFSTDSRTTLPGLSVAQAGACSASKPSLHGYIVGGYGTPNNQIIKFTFSSDSMSTLPSTMTNPTWSQGATSSTSAAYIHSVAQDTNGSTVDKIVFATDTKSSLPTGLSTSRTSSQAFASATSAYFGSGNTFPPFAYVYTNDKFSFADDSRSSAPNQPLASARAVGLASPTAGYISRGGNTYSSSMQKFAFSSETWSNLTNVITGANNTRGYVGQGGAPNTPNQ